MPSYFVTSLLATVRRLCAARASPQRTGCDISVPSMVLYLDHLRINCIKFSWPYDLRLGAINQRSEIFGNQKIKLQISTSKPTVIRS